MLLHLRGKASALADALHDLERELGVHAAADEIEHDIVTAADRLIDYLKRYMQNSEKGSDDPMYQMAMTLLERNKMGDLDYKSISKLYELEDKFDEEYADIMRLFKEANVVQRNAINYYFSRWNPENGVWTRIEPSFCRL